MILLTTYKFPTIGHLNKKSQLPPSLPQGLTLTCRCIISTAAQNPTISQMFHLKDAVIPCLFLFFHVFSSMKTEQYFSCPVDCNLLLLLLLLLGERERDQDTSYPHRLNLLSQKLSTLSPVHSRFCVICSAIIMRFLFDIFLFFVCFLW